MAKREMGKLLGGALGLAAFGGLIAAPQPAAALTINANFTNFGSNADEQNVFDAAIQWWEMIITTPFTFNVTVTRSTLGSGTLGQTSAFTENGAGRPVSATVQMGIRSDWFIDPTPHDESEFDVDSTEPPVFLAPPGSVANGLFDYLTVAKHELGHALGFTVAYSLFSAQVGAESGGTRPFGKNPDGTPMVIATLGPAADGTHLVDSGSQKNDLMVATLPQSMRRLQSELDCQMLSRAFGYDCSTTRHIPKPPTVFLLAIALLGLAGLHAAPRLRRTAV